MIEASINRKRIQLITYKIMQDLFDKILCEGQFKYEISFGSIEEYIKKLIPQNTQMNINIWNDKKKNFNPDDCLK